MSNPKHGSLEFYFTYPSDPAKALLLITNIGVRPQFAVGPEFYQPVSVRITSVEEWGQVFFQVQTRIAGVVVDRSDHSSKQGTAIPFAVRIFFFDQFLSVTINDVWVYSYAFAGVEYPEEGTLSTVLIMEGATTTVTDIRRVELCDGREAIFVDYESTTDNAIQSVIQQRPVQILPHVDRKITFTYNAEKDVIDAHFVHSYEEEESEQPGMSSDGMVYSEEVGVSIDVLTAKQEGLITKLYRLSELSNGAEKAAGVQQKQARERSRGKTVQMRLDPRIEITDILNVDMVVTSTQRHIQKQLIVEDISITLRDGEYGMSMRVREKSA